jgi:hypothetical protein
MRPTAVLPDGPDEPLATVADLTAYLAKITNATARGQLAPRVANAVVYSAGTLLRALTGDETDRRLRELEAQVAQLTGGRDGEPRRTA